MKKRIPFSVLLVLIAMMIVPSLALAQKDERQDGPIGIFENGQQYNEFMGGLKSLGDPEVNAMIPALNDLVLGQPIGETALRYGVNSKGSPVMSLLADERIRAELEIVDDQMNQLESINQQYRERIAKEVRSIDLTDSSDVLDTFRSITDSAKSDMENVFLPHQVERLMQLGARRQMARSGVLGALLTDPLASELGITKQQEDALRKSAKKIEDELARDIEALKTKARKKLFSNLSQDQQAKLDRLLGDEYQFADRPVGLATPPRGQKKQFGGQQKKPKNNDGERPSKLIKRIK